MPLCGSLLYLQLPAQLVLVHRCFERIIALAAVFCCLPVRLCSGGVLLYVALTGTCDPIGYEFQGVLS